MIHVSPIAEPATASQGVYDGEARSRAAESEKNGPGVFARILSGLIGKNMDKNHVAQIGHAAPDAQKDGEIAAMDFNENEIAFPASVMGTPETVAPETGAGAETDWARSTAFAPETGASDDSAALAQTFALFNAAEQAAAATDDAETAGPAPAAAKIARFDADGASTVAQAGELSAWAAKTYAGGVKNVAPDGGAAHGPRVAVADALAENARGAGESASTGTSLAQARPSTGEGAAAAGFVKQAETDKARYDANAVGAPNETRDDKKRNLVAEARELRNANARTETARSGAANHGEAALEATRASADGPAKEAFIEMRMPTQSGNSTATTAWESRPAQTFEGMLARELHQHLNGDIARQASILLRDGNEGVIRIALKPESLGNVKIRLEMAENKITGYIVVESEEALRAFERELASLEKEFRDAGFEGAELQMSLAGGGENWQWEETEDGRFMPIRLAASRYDDAAEMTETIPPSAVYLQGTGVVDVLA